MKPLLSNWTIVLAGRWNMEILNPEWVTEKIFGKENAEIDLVLNGMQANIRYRFDNLSFVPQPNNVIFSVNDTEDASLQSIEDAACKLLQALPITPITALGINFTYIEDETPLTIAKLFNISDSSKLADYGLAIKKTRIRREIDFADRQLNLIISQLEGTASRIALNYHVPTNDTAVALEALRGHTVGLRHRSEDLLSTIYDLTVQDDEDA
ncbi:hypothetical protein [Methylobacterium sp. R2-1]|uniref:hypothetical protein n=1 Tax=Methylobacterium sp. R2-1 TaxID=2587064 RepID=UPI00161F0BCA|nr:hypothetical protein [Methylobacterium sp. R2-1]MBB2960726.1 hypothetical protein [Methylobacterium sp. R2-1]